MENFNDNLRNELKEIFKREEFTEKISALKLDKDLLGSAFDVLLEDIENDDQHIAFQAKIINTLKSK